MKSRLILGCALVLGASACAEVNPGYDPCWKPDMSGRAKEGEGMAFVPIRNGKPDPGPASGSMRMSVRPPGGGGAGVELKILGPDLSDEAADAAQNLEIDPGGDHLFVFVYGKLREDRNGWVVEGRPRRSVKPIPAKTLRGEVTVSMAVDDSMLTKLNPAPKDAVRQIIANAMVAQYYNSLLQSPIEVGAEEDPDAVRGSVKNPVRTSGGPAGGL